MPTPAPKSNPLAPFEMAELRKFAIDQSIRVLTPGVTTPLDPKKVMALADQITVWVTTGVKP